MGADHCNCNRNENNQASITHSAPEKQDACKMFSSQNTSSMDLSWSTNGLVTKKTVYRGFTDDPNVKIRFIAETKKKPAASRPPPKQSKEQLKPDLLDKLNSLKHPPAYDEEVQYEKPASKFWKLDSPMPYELASTEPSENCYSAYNHSSGRKSQRSSSTL